MGKCIQCGVEILDETERCPLCRAVVEPDKLVENTYPNVRLTTRRLLLLCRIYLFCAIVAEVVLVSINVSVSSKIWWCAIPGLALLYGFLVLRYAVLGKTGYRGKIIVLTLLAIGVVIAIDIVTGYHGWSLNYALPGAILLVDAVILVLMFVNFRNWQSYMMWQIFMIVCSIIPIALYAAGLVTSKYVTFAAPVCSVFLFLGTLIIGGRRAKVELKRRFHV